MKNQVIKKYEYYMDKRILVLEKSAYKEIKYNEREFPISVRSFADGKQTLDTIEYKSYDVLHPDEIHTVIDFNANSQNTYIITSYSVGNVVYILNEMNNTKTINVYNNTDLNLLMSKTVISLIDNITFYDAIYEYTSYRHLLKKIEITNRSKREYFYSKNDILTNIIEDGVPVLTDGEYDSFYNLVTKLYSEDIYNHIINNLLLKEFEVIHKRPNSNTIVAHHKDSNYEVMIEQLPSGAVMFTETIGIEEFSNVIYDNKVYLYKDFFTKLISEKQIMYEHIKCLELEKMFYNWDDTTHSFVNYSLNKEIYDLDKRLLQEEITYY